MNQKHTATASLVISAPVPHVWTALVTPEIIKQYLFGTETECDWKKGSPIFFRGEWEGKKYEDKGVILDFQPEKQLAYSYWSAFSGTEDKPENYSVVMYRLESSANGTVLTIQQEGLATEESAEHSEKNWKKVLVQLRSIVERKQ